MSVTPDQARDAPAVTLSRDTVSQRWIATSAILSIGLAVGG